MLSDSQSRSRLLNQVIEIIGISPNRVCGSARSTNYFPSESEAGDISMDRQFSNHSPSETETEMPKWFNHQSVENSIFFWVGRKFPKLAICIVLGHEGFYFEVYISINGYEKYLHNHYPNSGDNNILQLLSPTQQSLQEHLNKSNPTDQNHVKLRELQTPTTKLRPTCNSFDSSFEGYEDILMKPEYFPALSSLELYGANIVTIPKSISRFPKLNSFSIFNCELLSEIQGLSRWIDIHTLLDSQSRSRLLNQVIELIGISPNRVCGRARSTNYFPSESEAGDISMDRQFSNHTSSESEAGDISMDRQFSNHSSSETEGVDNEGWISNHTSSESEAGDISMDRQFYNHYRIPNHTSLLGETEMPKWFNHQSVENPIDFWVGRKFPKLAICFVLGHKAFHFNVYISINGYWKFLYSNVSLSGGKNILHIFSPTQQSLQEHLNESNPTDQNHVKVGVDARSGSRGDVANYVKRLGVHVECICPPQESAIPNLPLLTTAHDDDDVVDHMRELPFYLSDDKEEYQSPLVHDDVVDHMRELPFYGSDDKEEYQSPLVHDDTSMSCMSWLSLFIVVSVCFLLTFDDKLTGMVAVEVTGRPRISFCLGCEKDPRDILLDHRVLDLIL
nr:hypothetical protein CFP56_60315 [Quercus suber]